MTITNHIRQIQVLASTVIDYVDDRNYCFAHDALVDIEKRARLAHEHIDKLQQVKPRDLLPAEGS